jgi:hypothetical protein
VHLQQQQTHNQISVLVATLAELILLELLVAGLLLIQMKL